MRLTLAILVAQAGALAMTIYYAVTRVRMLHRRVVRVEARPDLTERANELERETAELQAKVRQLAHETEVAEGRHLRVVPPFGGLGIGRGLLVALLLVGLTAAVTWLIADRDNRRGSSDFVAPPPSTTAPPAPSQPPPDTVPPQGDAPEGASDRPASLPDAPATPAAGPAGRSGAPMPQLPPASPSAPATTTVRTTTTTTTTTAPPEAAEPADEDCAAELNLGLLELCLL